MHRRRDLPIVQEKPRTRARRAKPDELTAARERIEELEARATQHARAEQVQAALYRIAETASAVEDMPAFYAAIHEIVGGLMYAENFYIALYDERATAHQLPVLSSTRSTTDIPDPNEWIPFGIGDASGGTGLRRCGTANPSSSRSTRCAQRAEQGEMNLVGAMAGRVDGRAAQGGWPHDRRRGGADVSRGPSLLARRPRAADVRRPAHRDGAGACPGDRGDAAAQRGARRRQRGRCRAGGAARLRLGDHGRGRPDPHDLPGLDRHDRAV